MKNIIMLHGRGATAESMLSFASRLPKANYIALEAPENNSWYPTTFLAPKEANEPHITNAINMILDKVKDYDSENIIILGFSQGACLATEFALRHPKRYGGLLIFSGGYIGDKIPDSVDLKGTPIFIGCSENDPFIPLKRVNETIELFKNSNTNLNAYTYEGDSHKISSQEVEFASMLIKNNE
jgi:phospholipase/carboxylesterase